jgi:hypothetical protein
MKTKFIYIFLFCAPLILGSCVTGGFNENPQLEEREAELAKAPNIESISINGTILQRNQQSLRIVHAKPGDVLSISVSIQSGKNAELKDLEVVRQYYGNEDPHPLDPNSPTGVYNLTGNTHVFDLNYTVPAEDDDGFEFAPEDLILVHLLVSNTLDNHGYRSFEIVIDE